MNHNPQSPEWSKNYHTVLSNIWSCRSVKLITVQYMSKCTFPPWLMTNTLTTHNEPAKSYFNLPVYLVTGHVVPCCWPSGPLRYISSPWDMTGKKKKKANLNARDMLNQQGLMGMSCENQGSLTGTDNPAIWLSTTGPKQSAATKRAGGEPGSGPKLQFACQQECWGAQTHHTERSAYHTNTS